MNIWAVANQKGGVGKTTTAITLAGILAKRGIDTLVIDLDPHGSLTSYLGIEPDSVESSVYDLYQNAAQGRQSVLADVVQQTRFDHLHLLPSSTALATLEKQLGSVSGMGLVLTRLLRESEEDYQYVLIDCPPMLGMLMVSALAACDKLLIPVQTEHLAIKGLQRMLRTLSMIQKSLNTSIEYSILPTMYDKRTLASKQSLQRIRNSNPDTTSSEVIPVDTRFRDASHDGQPMSYVSESSHGLRAYEAYLNSLLDQPHAGKVAMQ